MAALTASSRRCLANVSSCSAVFSSALSASVVFFQRVISLGLFKIGSSGFDRRGRSICFAQSDRSKKAASGGTGLFERGPGSFDTKTSKAAHGRNPRRVRLQRIVPGHLRVLDGDQLGEIEKHLGLLPGCVVLHLPVDHDSAGAIGHSRDDLFGKGHFGGVG